ncbi:VOC family protein [Flavobacterium daemonense]|uniref:VOC family protein n=1 Tax=Flavobacterium daemonense TaxID=1393049 RepID=UPI0011862451|nr:VOC family protein [Flavobacterium daemonense]KAF2337192.1 VOC family protein [Flavobacterium daemonense]
MKLNLDTIILYVQDVNGLKSFYSSVFGFEIVEEYKNEWVLLNAGNSKIGLHKIGGQYLTKIKLDHKFDNNTKIVFEINNDIHEVRQLFLDQNVLMREVKTFDIYDYWLCDGEDPEGNVFQLKQKK